MSKFDKTNDAEGNNDEDTEIKNIGYKTGLRDFNKDSKKESSQKSPLMNEKPKTKAKIYSPLRNISTGPRNNELTNGRKLLGEDDELAEKPEAIISKFYTPGKIRGLKSQPGINVENYAREVQHNSRLDFVAPVGNAQGENLIAGRQIDVGEPVEKDKPLFRPVYSTLKPKCDPSAFGKGSKQGIQCVPGKIHDDLSRMYFLFQHMD